MSDTENSSFFDLPNDYFLSSKERIMNRLLWEDEMQDYPSLSQKQATGMILPEGYLEKHYHLAELIPFPLLNSNKLKAPMVFKLPEQYFEESALYLRDNLKEMSITINSKPTDIPFDVPNEYFGKSKQKLLSNLTSENKTKTIHLYTKAISYSAAAMLVLALGLWLYKLQTQPNDALNGDCKTLACVEKRELLKYKWQHLETEDLYELINAEELEKTLSKSDVTETPQQSDDSLMNDLTDYLE